MSKITFTKDVLEEVAKEHGWHIEQVKYVYDLMIENIHDAAKEETSFRLPFLGTLYLKTGRLKRIMKHNEEVRGYYEDRVKRIEEEFEAVKNSRPKNYTLRWLPICRKITSSMNLTKGLSFAEMEEFQNEE